MNCYFLSLVVMRMQFFEIGEFLFGKTLSTWISFYHICVCISTTLGIPLKYNFNFLLINLILPPRSHYSILSVNSISDILKANFLAEVCKIARKIWKQPLILSVLHCHYYSYYISWPSDAMHLWDWGKLAETCPRAAASSSKEMEDSFTALPFEDVIPSPWDSSRESLVVPHCSWDSPQ